MKNILLTTVFSIIFFPSVYSQNFDSVQIKTTKLTESIYMLEGAGGNIGVLVSNDGIIIIDDQFAPLTEKIRAALSQISSKPVRFVINTHFHNDHTGGNENFSGQGAIILSHENARRRLTTDYFFEAFKETQKASPYEALPKVTFADSVTFHVNGETVHVFYAKNAHTDGDVIIHFKESNIFHCGDVFVRYGFPFIDQGAGGSIDGMIRACEQLIAITNDQTKIIPGHGGMSTRKDLMDYKHMLVTVRTRIADGIKQGKTLQQIADSDPMKGYTVIVDKWFFVQSIYNSLKK
ncbi:MAG TPA: MBL fold metallo-hydrolase [Chitinophagaceae bacterium]|nr:MBL fold metallo-hydrolase [Chitinophagaceae bacterium]